MPRRSFASSTTLRSLTLRAMARSSFMVVSPRLNYKRKAPASRPGLRFRSITIVVGLVRAADGHAQVVGLRLRQLLELHTDLLEVQARDLLVQVLRQHVDAERVLLRVLVELDLRQRLVREAVRHHEARS